MLVHDKFLNSNPVYELHFAPPEVNACTVLVGNWSDEGGPEFSPSIGSPGVGASCLNSGKIPVRSGALPARRPKIYNPKS